MKKLQNPCSRRRLKSSVASKRLLLGNSLHRKKEATASLQRTTLVVQDAIAMTFGIRLKSHSAESSVAKNNLRNR